MPLLTAGQCWEGICRALAVGLAPGPGQLIVMPGVTVEHTAPAGLPKPRPCPADASSRPAAAGPGPWPGLDASPSPMQYTVKHLLVTVIVRNVGDSGCSTSLSDLSSVNSTIRLASE